MAVYMRRRDVLKGAVVGLVATQVSAQEQASGPFELPTVRFKPGNQHELPPWAFSLPLRRPPVPLPVAVGTFADLHGQPIYGSLDPAPLGEAFHGIALEWGATPPHWAEYGCDVKLHDNVAWSDKRDHFGEVEAFDSTPGNERKFRNWGGFKIKCYKVPIRESLTELRPDTAFEGRFYGYAGMLPGPTFKMRLGEPVVVRFENHLETETSVHLHGGHSPSHSDGHPLFYILQGKSRDYFYPNILPLYRCDKDGELLPDLGESQSTMWYHDHALDATAYNVSKGLAGFAMCFGERELTLIRNRVLPGYGPLSCHDPTSIPYESDCRLSEADLAALEDPERPGFYREEKEPYFNPFDLPLVLQDKVIDRETGQIAYDLTSHDGYLGDTFFVNGVPWPQVEVRNRKYRLRILDGSNARVVRLRLMRAEDFWQAQRFGVDSIVDREERGDAQIPGELAGRRQSDYDAVSEDFLRIGKDSWLWSKPLKLRSVVLAMANRADLIVDFNTLTKGLQPGEQREFVLVNTMPQFDGRGPKAKLENGGDPRVLPLPFDVPGAHELVELNRPIGLMKFTVCYAPPGSIPQDPPGDQEATIEESTPLVTNHRRIEDHEVKAVREFVFERGKGAWQVNGRFYDPYLGNAAPALDHAEEWVLRNGGGGWWHPIHIHLESHQLIQYEKDFLADEIVDLNDPPEQNRLQNSVRVDQYLPPVEAFGLHDTQVLGPNTVARIRIRCRTWSGPFVFHCHNLEHEDMRMMHNFEPVPGDAHDPNTAPTARTHGNSVTLHGKIDQYDRYVGELPWEHSPVPESPLNDAGVDQIPPR